jgi:hypothetical protein
MGLANFSKFTQSIILGRKAVVMQLVCAEIPAEIAESSKEQPENDCLPIYLTLLGYGVYTGIGGQNPA